MEDPGWTARAKWIEHWQKMLELCFAAQVEWGKWLVASLLLAHGGALIALAQSSENDYFLLKVSGVYFTSGLVLSLICGFLAWINWSLNIRVYDNYIDMSILVDPDKWINEDPKIDSYITWTFRLCIISGICSVICILFAAKAILCAV